MKLDESVRARLRALERRDRGTILHGLAMASAAALVFAVVSSLDTRGAESLARTRSAPVAPPVAQAALIEAPRNQPVGPCADSANLTFPPGSGERRLDLGSRALFVANRPAIVGVTQTADCDLRAGLAEGGLAVHARDLEGRTLVVSTPRGDVSVKGSVFEVEFWASSGELTVGVDEGIVELMTAEGQTVTLEAGRAAYLGINLELESFDEGARARLRRVLGLSGSKRARL